ncbi:MAG: IS256 family transposase [Candidatus Acidiferrales bacterium]
MSKRRTVSRGVQAVEQEPWLSGPEVSVQVPLPLVASLRWVRQSFLDLCILVGQQVLARGMEEDRSALCGARGRHDDGRQAVRWGRTPSEVTLGGRRIAVDRLRARAVDGAELSLPWFEWAAERDPLNEQTLAQVLAGVSMRDYAGTLEPVPASVEQRAVSKSAVSRRFIALTTEQLRQWLARPLGELDLRVVILDGIAFRDRILLIALGVATDGTKHVLGLREGTTENATVCRALLRDLIDRGLPADRALLFVIDGAKGLRKAIAEVFGRLAVVQRCQVHKRRNVLEHLPEERRPQVGRLLDQAHLQTTKLKPARRQLEQLAASLDATHPGAAASVREGLEETLTLHRLGLTGALYRTLRSTNSIENLNGSVAHHTRNVRRWRDGRMIQRWVAMALVEAEKHFHRVRGHKNIKHLVAALNRHEQELQLDNQLAVA